MSFVLKLVISGKGIASLNKFNPNFFKFYWTEDRWHSCVKILLQFLKLKCFSFCRCYNPCKWHKLKALRYKQLNLWYNLSNESIRVKLIVLKASHSKDFTFLRRIEYTNQWIIANQISCISQCRLKVRISKETWLQSN